MLAARPEVTVFGLGVGELAIILVIVLIIFGAGKLPEIGEGLGRGIRNFRSSVKNQEIDVTPHDEDADESAQAGGQEEPPRKQS